MRCVKISNAIDSYRKIIEIKLNHIFSHSLTNKAYQSRVFFDWFLTKLDHFVLIVINWYWFNNGQLLLYYNCHLDNFCTSQSGLNNSRIESNQSLLSLLFILLVCFLNFHFAISLCVCVCVSVDLTILFDSLWSETNKTKQCKEKKIRFFVAEKNFWCFFFFFCLTVVAMIVFVFVKET